MEDSLADFGHKRKTSLSLVAKANLKNANKSKFFKCCFCMKMKNDLQE